jgi:aminoglycoside phosphotransferase (APT) family kinase protein
LTTVTTLPGWITPAELIDRYAQQSGHDLSTLRYFEVFALFKIAVVIQQIYYRFVKGQTDDNQPYLPDLPHLPYRVKIIRSFFSNCVVS